MTRRRVVIACALTACVGLGVVMALKRGATVHERLAPADAQVSAGRVTRVAQPAMDTRETAAAAELRQLLDSPEMRDDDAPALERIFAQARADAPWWNAPLPEVYDALLAAARGGNVEAMHAIGSRSLDCLRSLREKTPIQLLASFRDEIERIENLDGEGHAVHLSNATGQARRQLEDYRSCSTLGEAKLAGALDWVARAGHAGNDRARLLYARSVLDAYKDDRGALISDIEGVARRRVLARRWIEAGVKAGSEEALDMYAGAHYGQSGLYRRDLFEASTYSYVLDLVRRRRVNEFDKTWRDGPPRHEGWLTPQQWDEVQARGHAIFDTDFRDTPIWPGQR